MAPNDRDGKRWYVVQSQPNAERKAVFHLERQGFAAYLPRYLKRRRHARRVEIVAAPLFPRYLFVAIDLTAQRWRSVFSTVGVSHMVCHGECPRRSPRRSFPTSRRARMRTATFASRSPEFKKGDKIRVLEGVFADCLGLYEGMRDSERVAILLDLLGRKVRVTVDAQALVAS